MAKIHPVGLALAWLVGFGAKLGRGEIRSYSGSQTTQLWGGIDSEISMCGVVVLFWVHDLYQVSALYVDSWTLGTKIVSTPTPPAPVFLLSQKAEASVRRNLNLQLPESSFV